MQLDYIFLSLLVSSTVNNSAATLVPYPVADPAIFSRLLPGVSAKG